MPRITLQDIADQIGVSRATVSLALRSDPSIPKTTRQKVSDCARQMNYRPNPLISALMADLRADPKAVRTCTIAYVTNFTDDLLAKFPSGARYYEGASTRAAELGYRLDYFHCDMTPADQKRTARILLARGIPGALFSPGPYGCSVSMPLQSLCAAYLGYTLRSPMLNRSVNHQYHTIQLAMTKCFEYGYRRIALQLPDEDDRRVERLFGGGYLSFQQQLAPVDRLPILTSLDPQEIAPWIKTHRPEVIVSSRQDLSEQLGKIGLRVPHDLAVACLDRVETNPQTAGVDQMPNLVGAGGMDLVIHALMTNSYGLPESPRTVLVEGKWMDGPSLPPRQSSLSHASS